VIIYHKADERPDWVATVTVNGSGDDMSSGYTFQVKVATSPTATAALTKTTGITGAVGGVVTVAWASNELDLQPGNYSVQLKATRTSDSAEWTVEDTLKILPRL
jgi:hypothetical protein